MVAITETDNLIGTRRSGEWALHTAERLSLPLVLILALGVRLLLVARAPGILDGDEALVGLQAESIAAGRAHPLPVFFYGQPYMGSLEAYVAAGIFRLIGPSVPALRLAPLLFALLLVSLTYVLARWVAGRRAAVLAGVLAALPPLYVCIWSIKARGGYVETMALGTALLVVTHRLLYEPAERLHSVTAESRRAWIRYLLWVSWGFLAGLLWWVSPLSVPYIATGAGALILAALRRRGWRLSRSDLREAATPVLLILLAVATGGLPLWVDNLYSRGRTFGYLIAGSGSTTPLADRVPSVASYLVNAVLPKFTGAWEPWTAFDIGPLGGPVLAIYALAGAYLLIRLLAGRRGVLSYRARPRHGQGLVLAFAGVATAVFCFSGFGGIALNPLGFDAATRYALPLATVLPVAAGALAWRLWRIRVPLGAGVLAFLLVVNVAGYALARPDAMFQSEYWAKLPSSEEPLARFLESHGIRDVWMNHWAGYPLMFYADGRIAAADYNDVVFHHGVNRLPMVMRQVARDQRAAYVLITSDEDPTLEILLRWHGVRFTPTRIGHFLVIWNLSRAVPPSEVAAGIGFDV